GKDAWARPVLLRAMRNALLGNTGAHSAVEMALLDLAGRAAKIPMIELIGGAVRRDVEPMWLLGNAAVRQDINEARAKQREGFEFFKLKIGTKPIEKEITTALEIRAALGKDVILCADANCGLKLADAQRYAAEAKAANLLYLEQPFSPDALD